MANFNISTFLAEMQKLSVHWTQVNAALPATSSLMLTTSYSLTDFQSELAALQQDLTEIIGLENQLQGGAQERDTRRTQLRERHRRFRQGVQGRLAGTKYVAMLPTLPAVRATEGVLLKTFQDVENIWQQLDTDTVLVPAHDRPFLLAEDYGQPAFTAELAALAATYDALRATNSTLSTQRKSRDSRIQGLLKRARLYGKSALSRLPEGHPLTQNLPTVP